MAASTLSKGQLVQDEILDHLAHSKTPLSSVDLAEICVRNETLNALHKAVGILKKAGKIEIAGETAGPRGSTIRTYRLADPQAEAQPEPLTDQERELLAAALTEDSLDPIDAAWPEALEDGPAFQIDADHAQPTVWTEDTVRAAVCDILDELFPMTFGELRQKLGDPPVPEALLSRALITLTTNGAVGGLRRGDDWGYVLNFEPVTAPCETRRRGYMIARMIRDAPDPRPKLLEADAYAEALDACAERLEAGRALPALPEIADLFREMADFLRECA